MTQTLLNRKVIRPETMARVIEQLKGISLSQPIVINVSVWEEPKTIEQNSFYWVLVGAIAQEIGDTKNSVHEDLLELHYGVEERVSQTTGRTHTKPRTRTSQLGKRGMAEHIDWVTRWAEDEMGFILK